MGNQKTVVIGEEPVEEELGSPKSEHHGKKKEAQKKNKVAEEIKAKKFEKKPETAGEVESDETAENIEPVKGEEEKGEPAKIEKKKEKVGKAKVRSKRYQAAHALIDPAKKYDLTEAFDFVKKTSLTKFDGNVEVHARILTKSGKPENLRGFVKYPHNTGKKTNVIILDEKIAEEIEKTKKADADIYITTPEMMPKIAKLAKILGPKGKMPNPKSGTISTDPEKTKQELEAGQVEYKTDSYGNIHQVIGKVSADPKALEENFQALLDVLPKERIASLTICATMGPGVKVQF